MKSRLRTVLLATTSAALVAGAAIPSLARDTPTPAAMDHHHARPATPSPRARLDLVRLRRTMAAYRDPAAAIAAGWLPTDTCSALPDGSAGMGFHYVKPELLGAAPDPDHPAILVYVPDGSGGRTLGAVEWFQPDADQDVATSDDRPSLFGVGFDGPMLGHEPGMPVHYDLHAWLFTANPDGLLAPWNPHVHC